MRVVNREGLYRRQRQIVHDGWRLQNRKARAFGEQIEQETLPMEIPGRCDGPGVLQQVQRRSLAGLAGLDHSLVLGGVFVRPKQDFVQLLANWNGASARHQFCRPRLDLGLNLFLFLDGQQCLLHDLGGRFAKTPFTSATEVMWGFMQTQQCSHLLHRTGRVEIVLRQIGETKLFLGCKFVGQLQLDALAERCGLGQQSGWGGLVKFKQLGCSFDFDPFARIELNLCGGLSFGQDATGHELTGFFK